MIKYIILIIVVIALFVASTVVDAQDKKPVIAAYEIYKGCMVGYFMSANVKPTKGDIKEFVDNINEQCLVWMVIWYSPLTGYTTNISDWDDAKINLLGNMISKTMLDINSEMRIYLGVK